jgi:signal transduction histidine kinase
MAGAPVSHTFAHPRLRLARIAVSQSDSLLHACEHAARISAQTLRVARVGIWLFEEEGAVLRRWYVHEDPAGAPTAPAVLYAATFPTYMRALSENRWVCADDARTDEVTRELNESYLVPAGVTSMLDAPIFRGGDLFGVVCHEHTGPQRRWTAGDRAFAGSVADILALCFEQGSRLESERALREAELRQRQAQKLEVLGRLATGVAHDVNNIFTAVGLLSHRLAQPADADEREVLSREIRDAVTAGTALTSELMAFARQQSSVLQRLDLVETVAALAPVLRAVVGGGAALELILGERPLHVRASPGQVQQVLLNLVINGRQAMGKAGGTITVTVERALGEGGAPAVMIAVRDQGRGMSDEVKGRIFEPFFTTRAASGGSGIGLGVVKGIVDELGGRIVIQSSPTGTDFRVFVPASPAD